jgi:tetratricopeptide (TPR) repeat protein
LVEGGKQAWNQGLFQKSASYYNRAIQHLVNEIPMEIPTRVNRSEGLVQTDIDRTEIVELRLRALSGKGDAAIRNGDYLSTVVAYQSAIDYLHEEKFKNVENFQDEVMILSRKLALVMPTQNKVEDGIELLRNFLSKPASENDPIAVATFAWLLWRSRKTEAKKWITRCIELLEAIPIQPKGKTVLRASFEVWRDGVTTLMVDLSGDWKFAILDYLSFDLPIGAALAAIRLGDWLSTKDNLAGALHWYQQAGEIWRKVPRGNNGMVISLYSQAEIYWRMYDDQTASQLVEEAKQEIEESPCSLQATMRPAIQHGIALVDGTRTGGRKKASPGAGKNFKRTSKRWPTCNWQAYDDDFRIGLLFYPDNVRMQSTE